MNERTNENQDDRLGGALRSIYDTGEPSDNLRQEVSRLAAAIGAKGAVSGSRIPRLRAAFVAAMLTLVLAGAMAFRYFFYRPGELAIQMIPADAQTVVTVDLTPSPMQVPVFKRIGDSLRAANIEQAMRDMVQEEGHAGSVVSEIRPFLATSFAIATMDTGAVGQNGGIQPVVFLAMKDRRGVEQILQRYGTRVYRYDLTLYRFAQAPPDERMLAMELGDYLVLSPDAGLLKRVQLAANGKIPVVAHLPEYQAARAELPEDANMMVFMSPTALADADKTGRNLGFEPFKKTSWLAFSATIREDGIAFDYRWPVAEGMAGRAVAQIPGFAASDYGRLPAGAYGVLALSQPSAYWSDIRDLAVDDRNDRSGFNQGIQAFEHETGLSIANDILPGFNGHSWFAAYPAPADPDHSVDGMVLIDDAGGATPSRLADKILAYVDRAMAGHNNTRVRFVPERIEGATIWRLDPESEKSLHDAGADLANGVSGGKHVPDEGADKSGDLSADMIKGKTLTVAEVGGAVIIATSRPMLLQGIAAYRGQAQTLADDPAFTAMLSRSTQNPQGILMVHLAGIMEKLRPSLDTWLKNSSVRADDVVNLFGGRNDGLVVSGSYDGQIERGSAFLPLSYERLIDLIKSIRTEMQHIHEKKHEDPSEGDSN